MGRVVLHPLRVRKHGAVRVFFRGTVSSCPFLVLDAFAKRNLREVVPRCGATRRLIIAVLEDRVLELHCEERKGRSEFNCTSCR